MNAPKIKKLKQPFVGQLIRELRHSLGLTQEELATSLGISHSTVSRWERGTAKPSPVASSLIELKLRELGKSGKQLLQQYCTADFFFEVASEKKPAAESSR